MKKSARQKAIEAINQQGCLLVFPMNNRKEPPSIWSALYPRSEMRWEWDQEGDARVADLWHLREELSRSRQVIYAKWYQGRATFFSEEVFVNLLSYLQSAERVQHLGPSSREALESFLMDSPQSTKMIKENLGWQGKMMESHFNRAMKPLWNYLLLVAFGEVQDSSFPSLNIAATQNLFEELWLRALAIQPPAAEKRLLEILGERSLFLKQAIKIHGMRK